MHPFGSGTWDLDFYSGGGKRSFERMQWLGKPHGYMEGGLNIGQNQRRGTWEE